MLFRKYLQTLVEWKEKDDRKPLLVVGARQVGKTYLIKEFAGAYFADCLYVNFETNNMVSDIFTESIEPSNIIKGLEVVYSQKIDKKNTLIFFDEVQANPRALNSLKYFCENEPEYFVIAAGSLLGVHIKHENYSFPVGKVDALTIYPLDFCEFLIATDNESLMQEIKRHYLANTKAPDYIHKTAMDLFNDYLAVGGMPAVVSEYIKSNSVMSAVDIQAEILRNYRSDITKYAATSLEANRILAAFDSIPVQLAKDNKKFRYKLVKKGGTSAMFGDAIEWLVNAGLAVKCYRTKVGVPLKLYEQLESFKLYLNDVGLLTNLARFPLYLIKNREAVNEVMIGMLTENYVATCLIADGLNLNYWQSDYNAEIDFILQTPLGRILPLEVKAGQNTRSRSLVSYVKDYSPYYSLRVSTRNFGFENNIKSIPLYAAFCISKNNLDSIN